MTDFNDEWDDIYDATLSNMDAPSSEEVAVLVKNHTVRKFVQSIHTLVHDILIAKQRSLNEIIQADLAGHGGMGVKALSETEDCLAVATYLLREHEDEMLRLRQKGQDNNLEPDLPCDTEQH